MQIQIDQLSHWHRQHPHIKRNTDACICPPQRIDIRTRTQMFVVPSLPVEPDGSTLEQSDEDEENGEDGIEDYGSQDPFAHIGAGKEAEVEEKDRHFHGADLREVEEFHGEEDLVC